MAKSQAYRLMDAAKVWKDVSPTGEVPANERQARELVRVPPENRAEVWQKAREMAPESGVTSRHINQAARPFIQQLVEKDARAKKGFPTDDHKRGTRELILGTRDARGTIAAFLGVPDSLVSNEMYINVAVRTELAEQRERMYLKVGRAIGKTDDEVMAFLDRHSPQMVGQ